MQTTLEENRNRTVVRRVHFNYQDYLRIPDDKRCEIIDGELHMTPAPLTRHQKISGRIYEMLGHFVWERQLGEILYAPVDVVLSNEDIVQPDLLFIHKDRLAILTEKNVRGAPDLVIEILSPSNPEWDRENKRKLYEKYGVREYWIVDPDSQSIEILTLTDAGFQTVRVFTKGTHLRSPLLPELSLPIDPVFG